MHTYIYAALLASNYQKSADVTRYVTFGFQITFTTCKKVTEGYSPRKIFSTSFSKCVSWQKLPENAFKMLNLMIKFLTANEVCEWLRLSRKGLWELERAGKLIPDRIGSRLRYREHEIIQFLDSARAVRGRIQQANSHSKKDFPSQVQHGDIELGTGVGEAELTNADLATTELGANEQSTNPISERSIYTYIYAQSESTSVADIDAQFREDLKTLDIAAQNKFLPLGSAV